jgi:hypothetical protein
MSLWVKDPADVAWYKFDWSRFLDTGDTITSFTVSVDSNLTKMLSTNSTSSVSFQVSGGVSGSSSVVTCVIGTAGGNTFETTKTIYIQSRVSNQ